MFGEMSSPPLEEQRTSSPTEEQRTSSPMEEQRTSSRGSPSIRWSPSTHLLRWPEMSLRENWGQNMSSVLRLDDLLQISWPSSSPFITLLSCSISIIAIIRRWLTKWQGCRCSVSPRRRTRPSSEQPRGWNRGWRWQDDRVRFPSLTSAEPGPTQRQQNPPEPLTNANVVVHLLWVQERSSRGGSQTRICCCNSEHFNRTTEFQSAC